MQDTSTAIASLKKQMGANLCIMGHHYQNDAIVQHCDITGDSLELARRVPGIEAAHIVFCGVYFMGESAALLAKPGQNVHLPSMDADCLMSRQTPAPLARKVLEQLAARGRKIIPLAYVNTDLALKAVVGEFGGAVCTSANAKVMLRWALDQGDGVLFLPDRHLGNNTAEALGISQDDRHVLRVGAAGLVQPETQALDRKLLLWPGCCAIHARFEPDDVEAIRAQHPGCRVIAHPECRQEVIEACDGAGSTSYLIKEAARVAADPEQPGQHPRKTSQYQIEQKFHDAPPKFDPHGNGARALAPLRCTVWREPPEQSISSVVKKTLRTAHVSDCLRLAPRPCTAFGRCGQPR